MELKWLEDFVALARNGSFSSAAVDRNVTQPALSRRIRALEGFLGATLADRSVFPVTLTHYGREFLPVAQQIIASTRAIREDFRHATGAERRQVRIVTLHTLAVSVVPALIAPLLHAEPQLDVEIVTSVQGIESHFDTLDSDQVQLLIAYAQHKPPVRGKDYDDKLVALDALVPVVSRRYVDHGGRHDLRRDRGIPFLKYSPFTFSSAVLDKPLLPLRDRLTVRAESALGETLKALVLQDLGLAWLPRSAITSELASGVLLLVGGAERFSVPLEIRAWRRLDLTDRRAVRLFEHLPAIDETPQEPTP